MEQSGTAGFVVNPAAIDAYVRDVVNPAVANFDKIASRMWVNQSASRSTLHGAKNMPGSTEFTGECEAFLGKFFELHGSMLKKQQAITGWVTSFRDRLQETSANYLRADKETSQLLQRVAEFREQP